MMRVLVVAAHPDDEAVGCGGTLRRHVLDGDQVSAVFLTSGESGGHGIEDPGPAREREAIEAAEIIGIREVEFWHEPDARVRARRALVDRLATTIAEQRPAVLYAPHAADDHPDHRAAARIVGAAVLAVPSRRAPEVRHFEIWTPIAHIDHVIDISEVIDCKRRAIRAYRSQCAVMAFDDAFDGLARYRGEMHSWPGGLYAEVFSDR